MWDVPTCLASSRWVLEDKDVGIRVKVPVKGDSVWRTFCDWEEM
jgi:hypothetical protein